VARRDERTPVEVAIAALVLSVVGHLLLWPLSQIVGLGGDGPPLPRTDGVMEVSLVDPREHDDFTEEELEQKQIVDLDYLEKEEAPDDAKYLAEFDSNPTKQYRAPKNRPSPTGGGRPDAQEQPKQPDPARTQKDSGMALPLGGREADAGQDDPTTPGEKSDREDDNAKPQTLSPRGARGLPDSLRKEWGTPGTHDDLDEDLDVGPGNLLETKRYKYASFFNRMRNAIAQYWHPEVLLKANDPDGRVLGTKDRKTRLLISLNPDGSLHKVRLDASSNVDYLDEEAIRAVRQAAPFANPPPGLVNEGSGLIEFTFGFIIEMDGSRRIFRYKN
jgi:TonB family protein